MLCALLEIFCGSGVDAFQARPLPITKKPTSLHLVPDIGDLVHQHQHLMDAASQLLVADGDGGFDPWNSYLLLFENTLRAVHDTIKGPLGSLGIEQTWGPSIFIFTASKFGQ